MPIHPMQHRLRLKSFSLSGLLHYHLPIAAVSAVVSVLYYEPTLGCIMNHAVITDHQLELLLYHFWLTPRHMGRDSRVVTMAIFIAKRASKPCRRCITFQIRYRVVVCSYAIADPEMFSAVARLFCFLI